MEKNSLETGIPGSFFAANPDFWLRILLDGAKGGVVATSTDGVVLDANQAFLSMSRRHSDEVIGKNFPDLCSVADTMPMSDVFSIVLGGEPLSIQGKLLAPDGGHDTEINLHAAAVEVGGETLVCHFIDDIGERLRHDEVVRERERYLKNLLDSIPAVILLVEAARLKIVDANQAAIGLLVEGDIGVHGLVGRCYDRLFEVSAGDKQVGSVKVEGGKSDEVGYRFSDGELRHFLRTESSLELGGFEYLLVCLVDITARKTAEEKLRRFRAALDISGDSVFLIDRDSMRLIDVNTTACSQLGYRREELLAMGPHDIKPEYPLERLRREYDKLFNGELAMHRIETVHRRKDGGLVPVEIILRSLKSPEHPSVVIASVRDITERRRSERQLQELNQALRQLNQDLERRVEERTSQLARKQAQLIHTERLAALGEMATAIAHELNQPLQVIKLSADGIDCELADDNSELAAAISSYSVSIGQQVERAAKIINNVRSFVKCDDGAVLGKTDLAAATRDAVGFFSEQLRLVNISLRLELEDGLPGMPVHQQRFQQIVVNLVGNARQAVEQSYAQGGGLIKIKLFGERRPDAPELRGVVLEVADNGAGMSEKVRRRCMDPFFSTRPQGEGTGLGLSIVYGIVREFRGAIEIESAPGKGSVFRISIPVPSAFEYLEKQI